MSEEYTFRTGVRARHGAVITQGTSWHIYVASGTWFPCSMHRQIGGWTIYIKQKPVLASHRGNSQGQHHLQHQDDLVPALYQHSWRGYGEICDAPVSDLTRQGTSSAACVGACTVSLHQSDYAPRSATIGNVHDGDHRKVIVNLVTIDGHSLFDALSIGENSILVKSENSDAISQPCSLLKLSSTDLI